MSVTESAKYVGLADARIEGTLLASMKFWASTFPDELIAFDKQMKSKRWANTHNRRKGTHSLGMSNQGSMLEKGEVPVRLYKIISKALGSNDWTCDSTIMNKFWSLFKVGCINDTSRWNR